MRWRQNRRSSNIEDRRGQSGGNYAGLPLGNILSLLPLLLRSKLGWVIIIGFVAFQYFGGSSLFQSQAPQSISPNQPGVAGNENASGGSDEVADFVSVVLASTEDVWGQVFSAQGSRYRPPTLVLYDDRVRSACGLNSSAVGPFYCPGDNKVYLDLSFLNELKRLGAPGDFAFAYVIAHEVGHHVQNLLGTEQQVQSQRLQSSQVVANRLSVRLELQADCYAGVWGHYANQQQNLLEPGDIQEGIRAAGSVGDDRLMAGAGQAVQPDAFTHGSSEQRIRWFQTGLASGDPGQCNTFTPG